MITIQLGEMSSTTIPNWQVFSFVGILLAVTIVFYLLRSIGLFVLAKRKGVQHAFIAWIPLIWIFVACKIIGKVKFFGKPLEKLAVLICIIFAVSELITLVSNFLVYFPIVGNFLVGHEICFAGSEEGLIAG